MPRLDNVPCDRPKHLIDTSCASFRDGIAPETKSGRAAYSGPRYIWPAGRFLLRCSGARTNVPAYLGGGSMPTRPGALILVACLVLPLASAACSLVPAGSHADLAPTLSFQDKPGGPVAFQSGQPVPTFDREPRLRADLDGVWRFDRAPVDTGLSLTNRSSVRKALDA